MPINFQQYHHYFQKIRTNSPRDTFRKISQKIRNRLTTSIDRLHVRWFSSTLSDVKFLRSLALGIQTVDAFRAHLVNRLAPAFFISVETRSDILSFLKLHSSQSINLIIDAADTVCAHRFDLLGSGPSHLGETIDWHRDYKSGYRWNPRQYYCDIKPAPYPGGYDLKTPWELSRCQHFAWLGQAYWITDNEKYAQEFVAQVTDWNTQNPPRLGVNWACTMDVAIRSVNWLWAYYFFQRSPSLTPEFLLQFFKSLLQHGTHIRNNLEYSDALTSNHYLSNIVGLVYLGILLPEFKEAKCWLEFALQELEKEMVKQVYHDGVVFESSISYHRLSSELFLSATILAQLNGHKFSNDYLAKLEKMIEFIMYITKPDGTVPLIGDCDNGRLHRLKVWKDRDQEWCDFRYMLAIGSVLFDRSDFAQAAQDQWEDAIWIWGMRISKLKHEYEQVALIQPVIYPKISIFPISGISVLRHQNHYMLAVTSTNGQNGHGGHAHNDKLSFEFYAEGRNWFVDPGTFLYTADHQQRNLFRSTSYHNTLLIDRKEQNRFSEDVSNIFYLYEDTKPRLCHHSFDDQRILWIAEHDGYSRLLPPAIHRRTIYCDLQTSIWLIQDQVKERSDHACVSYFHIAPDIYSSAYEDKGVILRPINNTSDCLILLPLQVDKTLPSIQDGWISKGYGFRQPSQILAWEWQENIDTVIWAIYVGRITNYTIAKMHDALDGFLSLGYTQNDNI